MTWRDNLPGLLFLVAVLGLAGSVVGALTAGMASVRSGYDYGAVEANEARAIVARSVEMRPGDRLVVQPNLAGAAFPAVATYDLYVVNGGDRERLLAGEAPRAVYVHVRNMSSQGCCPQETVVWDRPDDAFARRPSTPPPRFDNLTEEQFRAAQLAVLDQPERVDLVWVLQYRNASAAPGSPEESRLMAERIQNDASRRLAFQPVFDPGYPSVFRASAAQVVPPLLALAAVFALVACGALLAWALRLRRAHPAPDAPGTEPLLRLYDSAGAWLQTVRDLLLGSLVVVIGVALHVALLGEPQAQLRLVQAARIGTAAWSALPVVLSLLYASVLVAWGYAVLRVHRALRAWRRRRDAPVLP